MDIVNSCIVVLIFIGVPTILHEPDPISGYIPLNATVTNYTVDTFTCSESSGKIYGYDDDNVIQSWPCYTLYIDFTSLDPQSLGGSERSGGSEGLQDITYLLAINDPSLEHATNLARTQFPIGKVVSGYYKTSSFVIELPNVSKLLYNLRIVGIVFLSCAIFLISMFILCCCGDTYISLTSSVKPQDKVTMKII